MKKFLITLICVCLAIGGLTACKSNKNDNLSKDSTVSRQTEGHSVVNVDTITDISNWNHPVKQVFQDNSITINKVELLNNKTYPIFYISFNRDIQKSEGNFVTELINKLAKANGFWDYKIVDSIRKIIIEVECDRSGRTVKTFTFNGKKDYFKTENAKKTESEILASLDKSLVDMIQKDMQPGYIVSDILSEDVDMDGWKEIFVAYSNKDDKSSIDVRVYVSRDNKYKLLDVVNNSAGAGWIELPLRIISIDKSSQKYVLIDVTNGWGLGHVLFTVKGDKVETISSKFPATGYGTRSFQVNNEGFYDQTYYQAYKGTVQGFTVGKLYRWDGKEFKYYRDNTVYEDGKGKFVYPEKPMDVIRGYLEAKVCEVYDDARKYLVDESVKEIQIEDAIQWENDRYDGIKFSKQNILKDTETSKVIEVATSDRLPITFTLSLISGEWKIEKMDTKRLQIQTTNNISLKEDDFNVSYNGVNINSTIPVEEITDKLGFGEGHEENNYGLISQYNGIKRWGVYYPNRQNTELRLTFLNGETTYLVFAELLKVPTSRGLKVGDPIEKLLATYGFPNNLEYGVSLRYNLGDKYIAFQIDENRTKLTGITIYYNMERSIKEQMGN